MSTTPLPSAFLKQMRNGFEFDLYTAEQVQQARADLEAENARLREALTEIAEESDDPGAVACASAALKGTP